MASLHPPSTAVGPDTPITVKVLVDGTNRRFKLPLRDLGAHVLPLKLRLLLGVPPESDVHFERYSDSASSYIRLDSTNAAVYKQLYRAAKAKLKLRLRATIIATHIAHPVMSTEVESPTKATKESDAAKDGPRQTSYLETVLSQLPPLGDQACSKKITEPFPCAYTMPGTYTACTRSALSHPTLPSLSDFSYGSFSIDCNYCGITVPNEHYHCSICEQGDFDLCQSCVNQGLTCAGDDHWLIKRTIQNGRVFPSVTEKLQPKAVTKQVKLQESTAISAPVDDEEERTCNSCINQLAASSFVTCKDCPDFDLCYSCFDQGEHGHHPAHAFEAVDDKSDLLTAAVKKLLDAGRGLKHEAYCDGCDKRVVGVRHKCLTCPDFDFCSACAENAKSTHPGHRFAPLHEQLRAPECITAKALHRGIFCDGARCAARARRTWIRGDRYKCSVCDDFDLCADCEASPVLAHNITHPLIKIKTPIGFVSISTIHEDEGSSKPTHLGDRKNASTETTRTTSMNAATQVQTVAEVKPTEESKPSIVAPKAPASGDLQAWFESDSTPDGTTVEPDHHITQSWTLRNPGPHAWPAGCAVCYTGGDDMRNLDMRHPSSVSSLTAANQSNVLSEALEPGNIAVFTVLLKSPMREGRAISYWRLKTPEGIPFGHKLWVDINIVKKTTHIVEALAAPVPEPFKVTDEEKSQESSTMIFPTLEKESPESSILEVSKASTVVGESTAADEDLIEDLESLDLEEETQDGFLTDEEYDILDADDEEFLEEAQRAVAGQK